MRKSYKILTGIAAVVVVTALALGNSGLFKGSLQEPSKTKSSTKCDVLFNQCFNVKIGVTGKKEMNSRACSKYAEMCKATPPPVIGTLVIEKANDTPSSLIQRGSADVVVGKWNLFAFNEKIEVAKLCYSKTGLNASTDFTGTTKVFNGSNLVFSGPAGTAECSYITPFTVSPTTPAEISIIISISPTAGIGNTIQYAFDHLSGRGLTSGAGIIATPSSVAANTMTIGGTTMKPSLSVTKDPFSPSGGYIADIDEMVLGSWDLAAGPEDVEVRSLCFDLNVTNNPQFDAQDVQTIRLRKEDNYSPFTPANQGYVYNVSGPGFIAQHFDGACGSKLPLTSYFTVRANTTTKLYLTAVFHQNATTNGTRFTTEIGSVNFVGTTSAIADTAAAQPVLANEVGPVIPFITGILNVSRDNSMGNRTVAPGNNVPLAQFIVSNSAQGPVVDLNQVFIRIQEPTFPSRVSNLVLKVDGGVGGTFQPGNNLQQFLPTTSFLPDQQHTFTIYGDVATSAGSITTFIDPFPGVSGYTRNGGFTRAPEAAVTLQTVTIR